MKCVLAFALLLASFCPLQAQWMQTKGPTGGWVGPLAVVDTVLVLPGFRSSDRCKTWTRYQSNLSFSSDIVSFLAHGQDLFAIIADFSLNTASVMLSTDKGVTWVSRSTGLPSNFRVTSLERILPDGSSTPLLFVSGQMSVFPYRGAVYRSTNYGASWSDVGLTAPDYTVVNLASRDTLLFGRVTSSDTLLRSNDRGATWSKILLPPEVSAWMGVATAGKNLFASTEKGVFQSTDDGDHWRLADTSEWARSYMYSVASYGAFVFLGFGRGVLASSDSGNTWAFANRGLPSFYPHAYSMATMSGSQTGTTLFACVGNYGVFSSTDNATNWVEANTGLTGVAVTTLFKDSSRILAGSVFRSSTRGQLFISSDDGDTWIAADTVLGGPRCFLRKGTKLFTGTSIGVWLSTDHGVHWTEVSVGLPTIPPERYVYALANIGDDLFAAGSGSGVYRSSNEGTSWIPVNSGLSSGYFNSLAVIDSTLFAGIPFSGVFRSTNRGTSWTAANNGLTNTNIYSLAAVPHGAGGTNLFAGVYGALCVSTDNGVSWTPRGNGLQGANVYSLLSIPVIGGEVSSALFTGTSKGLFFSTDDGVSWNQAQTGLPANVMVTSVCSGPKSVNSQNPPLFAVVDGHIWRRPLSEMITTPVHDLQVSLPFQFCLSQNFPNPFNPSTTIRYSLPFSAKVKLIIHDLLGREIATLVNEEQSAGWKEARWDAGGFSSGIYSYKLRAGSFVETKKMILLR